MVVPLPTAALPAADGPSLDWLPADGDDGVEPGQEADLESQATETRALVVDAQAHGQRLDKVLAGWISEFSRSHLQGLISAGHVRLDGQKVELAARRLRLGQRLSVDLVPTAQSRAFRAQPMALNVVFEDEHVLVLDKPSGLVVHPAPGNWSGTLLNGLLAYHAGAVDLPRAGIVHRLDKDTSGLMVVAKSLPAMTALVRAIAGREVQREYLALAHGLVAGAAFSIEAPIGRDPKSRVRMAIVASGKPARTDVMPLAQRDGISALRCKLHSGRTHQIRVHLASRGHPLVADALYGGAPALGLTRQALHATALRFCHPITAVELAFECPPPPDLAAAWRVVTDARGGH